MERFLQQRQDRITGVLSGFDRMLFRGTLRSISYYSEHYPGLFMASLFFTTSL